MTESNSLPSALTIAAEVDAALAEAGLAGPQVEREAIPLYLSFVHELIDCPQASVALSALNKSNAAELVAQWVTQKQQPVNQVVDILTEHLTEVIELSRVHGTLQDFKRRELLSFHRNIVEYLQRSSTSLSNAHNKSS
ncbi:MAG: hypothetical protein JKY50_03210 [Oleispira sp.]|nr:hypothetical protein [Oleispira sp.]MBL4881641.1 hypothetical protein [Oleispira sp.]